MLIETMTRVKQQLGSQQVSLSNLVMRVNNLLERKTRREAQKNGTAVKHHKSSIRSGTQTSQFSGKSGVSKKSTRRNKAGAKDKSTAKTSSKLLRKQTTALVSEGSSDGDGDNERRERQAK